MPQAQLSAHCSSSSRHSFAQVPKSLVLIGGGVIGLEMGSVWARLGSKVTVVEYLDRVCPSMDHEITKAFTRVLKKQGLKFKLNTKVGDTLACTGRRSAPFLEGSRMMRRMVVSACTLETGEAMSVRAHAPQPDPAKLL